MHRLAAYVLALVLATECVAEDVCYDDVGCFTTDWPWSDVRRPLSNLPQPPDEIPTRFFLYTRNVPEKTLIAYNGTDFGDFSPERKTMILAHGFNDNGNSGWMRSVKDMVLEQWDYNVILTDWGPAAKLPYLQASANAQLVGRLVALLAKTLIDIGGASAADLHLLAHSLGCHVCGYAGARIPGLARITGLDPAEPYFEDTQPEVHLDPTDAEYVDIIHTDGRPILYIGMGFTKACGHVDFFPNGGKNQPGCGDFEEDIAGLIYDLETLDIDQISVLFGCSHQRAQEVMEATLRERSCPFVGFSCASYEDYLQGDCRRLEKANIGRMGMDSVKFNLSGSYYLQTTSDPHALCMHYLEIVIQLSEAQEQTRGNMVFVMHTNSSSTEQLPGWISGTDISADGEVRTTVHSPLDPAGLTSLQLTFHGQGAPPAPALRLARVTVLRVDTDLAVRETELCAETMEVEDKGSLEFRPCA